MQIAVNYFCNVGLKWRQNEALTLTVTVGATERGRFLKSIFRYYF